MKGKKRAKRTIIKTVKEMLKSDKWEYTVYNSLTERKIEIRVGKT